MTADSADWGRIDPVQQEAPKIATHHVATLIHYSLVKLRSRTENRQCTQYHSNLLVVQISGIELYTLGRLCWLLDAVTVLDLHSLLGMFSSYS
jgi:hypothetical protein